jgi:uncharacterized protein YodC (DUF2158 family)
MKGSNKNMAEQTYKIGDQVQLKSGGPVMTVNRFFAALGVHGEAVYRCQWFAGKKLESGDFAEEALQIPAQES